MKFILFLFLSTLTSFVISQNFIDTKSIELKILDLNSKHRVSKGESERTYSEVCKKAADLQLDYLVKNSLISHSSNITLKGKKLLEPYQRFDYFNKDSIKPANSSGKIPLNWYVGEVIGFMIEDYVNDSTINNKIATNIYNGFCNSKMHNYIINAHNYFAERKTTGYFSVKVRVLEQTTETLNLEIYCVGVMSNTYKQ